MQAFDEEAARVLGLNLTDLRCVGVLDRRVRMTAGDLARSSGLTTGSVTALIDRLERAGYARRVRDTEDRRRVFVELTDRFAELRGKIWGPLAKDGFELMERYSDDDLRLIRDYLAGARDVLRRHRARVRELADQG